MKGYSMESDPDKTSRALGKDIGISLKKTVEVCDYVRGMRCDVAKDLLREVIDGERAIPFKRYAGDVGHRPGMGPGRYPKNSAKAVLRLIEEAEANAEYKGLDIGNMRIKHIAANGGEIVKAFRPRARGRSSPKNKSRVNLEIILEEIT